MPFLNLDPFSALSIVSGIIAFQRMFPQNASEFISKDIVFVGGTCSVFLFVDLNHRSVPSARKIPP